MTHAFVRRGGFALVAVLAVVGSPTAVHAEVAGCGTGSWIAGTVDVCDGTIVYRDYVYDDYGADTGAVGAASTGTLSNPAGDQRYSPEPGENSADIVSITLERVGGDVHLTAVMNSPLLDGSTTTLAVAVDTDGDPATGGGPWPSVPVSSSGWEEVYTKKNETAGTRTIELSFPTPAGPQWRIQAAAAKTDGTVMNVAFRGTDETGTWWEDRQAAALASGDISEFGLTIDSNDFDGVSRRASPGPGFYERVYVSDFEICNDQGRCSGIDYDGVPGPAPASDAFGQSFQFLGRNQPYGLYVPDRSPPHGLQQVLHGYSANHSSLINQAGMQQIMGESLNRILIVPLGRGPEGFYSGFSEQDVLDVMADVVDNYDVDENRVFAGGYSMGGYGSLRFAALYPDRFAGWVSWVGYPGSTFPNTPLEDQEGSNAGALGDMREYLVNLRWVPGAGLYTGADELVNILQGVSLDLALRETGYPYVFFLHPVAEHFTLALADDWRKESEYLRGRVRIENPPRVTFRTNTAVDTDQGDGQPLLVHDGAYWVSDITGRTNPGFVDVDLTSHGCGGEIPFTEPRNDVGIDPVPWIADGAIVTGAETVEPENRLSGTLSNVASATIDLDATCLDPAGLDTSGVTTDGATTLRLVREGETTATVEVD